MISRRPGFTLIELLIVILVVGVLAAIAIPLYGDARERVYVSAMRSDLRSLLPLQEIYHASYTAYGGGAGVDASTVAGLEFETSSGVTVTIEEATISGWSAKAEHAGLSATETCAVFYGEAGAVAPATTAGVVTCTTSE